MTSVATMARALLYLRVTSLIGRITSRLKRLKQPKYLAGAVVGAAYVYFSFLRRAHGTYGGHRPGAPPPGIPADALAFFPDLVALILLIVLVANWAMPRYASLAFSEAEIAFLFPAPVNRRMLVHYRLLGSQLGIAITALVFTVIFRRGQAVGGNAWFHIIGWWLILATLNLHFTGTAFVYSKLLNRSLTTRWRTVTTIAAVGVVICAVVLWAWSAMSLPTHGDLTSLGAFMSYIAAQLHAGPLPWLLAIPKLVIAPYFASSVSGFLLAVVPAVAVLVAHYYWVVHTEVSFEDASIAKAEKRAARVRAAQQGDWRGQQAVRKARRPPFRLRDGGRPELAFLWKNLLSSSAFFRPVTPIVLVAVILVGSEWLVRQPALEPFRVTTTLMFGIFLGVLVLIGPMIARQDLRSDLPNSDILKSYPLPGWRIVLGELLTPVSILVMLIWVSLLAEFLLLPSDRLLWLTPSLRAGVALGLAVLAPPFVAIQLLVANAATVLFPAWALSSGDRTERGIEVMGQRMIFIVGQLLITIIAAVPAAIAAAVIFLLGQWLFGLVIAGALAVAAVCALLTLEAWLGVRWLGRRFEHFDLSAELRP